MSAGGSQLATTTTTLTSSGSPALVGTSVTFTATVTGNNPTGSVTFTEGGNAICAAGTLSGTPRTASCSTSSLAVGAHSIVANYAGDAGNAPSSSTPLSQVINGTTVPAAATFVGTDVATQGNWRGVYGADGYAIFNDSTSYPAYAQVTPERASKATCGTRNRAPMCAPCSAPASGRIAACWYSPGLVGGSFSIDVNLTDGAAHRVALYLLDWDNNRRVIRVDVLDAATQQVPLHADAAVVQRRGLSGVEPARSRHPALDQHRRHQCRAQRPVLRCPRQPDHLYGQRHGHRQRQCRSPG